MEKKTERRAGMTLVELLVVMAVIAILVSLLLPAVQAARESARKTRCLNRMRQVSLAMVGHCTAHYGKFPKTSHTASEPDKAWIFSLAPYMESVDAIRICPDDPQAEERLAHKHTSYVLNPYITDEPPDGKGVPNLYNLKATSKTVILFELADGAAVSNNIDHVHAFTWFSPINILKKKVYSSIAAEISTDRHRGATHFGYADGHVATILAEEIREWALEPFNFALPQ